MTERIKASSRKVASVLTSVAPLPHSAVPGFLQQVTCGPHPSALRGPPSAWATSRLDTALSIPDTDFPDRHQKRLSQGSPRGTVRELRCSRAQARAGAAGRASRGRPGRRGRHAATQRHAPGCGPPLLSLLGWRAARASHRRPASVVAWRGALTPASDEEGRDPVGTAPQVHSACHAALQGLGLSGRGICRLQPVCL